jgi:hypothetical protein
MDYKTDYKTPFEPFRGAKPMGLKINDYGKIIFRHPHVVNGKYGKVICVAVAKLTGERQGKVKDGLESLLDAKPLLPDEFKVKVDQIAFDAYFDPMTVKTPDVSKLKGRDVRNVTLEQRRRNLGNKRSTEYSPLLVEAQQRVKELEAVRSPVGKAARRSHRRREAADAVAMLYACLLLHVIARRLV